MATASDVPHCRSPSAGSDGPHLRPQPLHSGNSGRPDTTASEGRPGARRRLKLDPKKEMVFLPLKFGSLGMKAKMIVIINFVS